MPPLLLPAIESSVIQSSEALMIESARYVQHEGLTSPRPDDETDAFVITKVTPPPLPPSHCFLQVVPYPQGLFEQLMVQSSNKYEIPPGCAWRSGETGQGFMLLVPRHPDAAGVPLMVQMSPRGECLVLARWAGGGSTSSAIPRQGGATAADSAAGGLKLLSAVAFGLAIGWGEILQEVMDMAFRGASAAVVGIACPGCLRKAQDLKNLRLTASIVPESPPTGSLAQWGSFRSVAKSGSYSRPGSASAPHPVRLLNMNEVVEEARNGSRRSSQVSVDHGTTKLEREHKSSGAEASPDNTTEGPVSSRGGAEEPKRAGRPKGARGSRWVGKKDTAPAPNAPPGKNLQDKVSAETAGESPDVCSLCSCHRSEAAQHFATAQGHDMSLWSMGWQDIQRRLEPEGDTMGTSSFPRSSTLQLFSKGSRALDAFVKDIPSDWVSCYSLPRRLPNNS